MDYDEDGYQISDDWDNYTEPDDEPEPEPAPQRQAFPVRYVTIALIVLAIIVQLGLVRQCTQKGGSPLYCTLAN